MKKKSAVFNHHVFLRLSRNTTLTKYSEDVFCGIIEPKHPVPSVDSRVGQSDHHTLD